MFLFDVFSILGTEKAYFLGGCVKLPGRKCFHPLSINSKMLQKFPESAPTSHLISLTSLESDFQYLGGLVAKTGIRKYSGRSSASPNNAVNITGNPLKMTIQYHAFALFDHHPKKWVRSN